VIHRRAGRGEAGRRSPASRGIYRRKRESQSLVGSGGQRRNLLSPSTGRRRFGENSIKGMNASIGPALDVEEGSQHTPPQWEDSRRNPREATIESRFHHRACTGITEAIGSDQEQQGEKGLRTIAI